MYKESIKRVYHQEAGQAPNTAPNKQGRRNAKLLFPPNWPLFASYESHQNLSTLFHLPHILYVCVTSYYGGHSYIYICYMDLCMETEQFQRAITAKQKQCKQQQQPSAYKYISPYSTPSIWGSRAKSRSNMCGSMAEAKVLPEPSERSERRPACQCICVERCILGKTVCAQEIARRPGSEFALCYGHRVDAPNITD